MTGTSGRCGVLGYRRTYIQGSSDWVELNGTDGTGATTSAEVGPFGARIGGEDDGDVAAGAQLAKYDLQSVALHASHGTTPSSLVLFFSEHDYPILTEIYHVMDAAAGNRPFAPKTRREGLAN